MFLWELFSEKHKFKGLIEKVFNLSTFLLKKWWQSAQKRKIDFMNTLRNDEKMVKNGCVKINRGVYSNYRKRYRKHYRKQYRESTAKQKVVLW